jgi:hypothetical protein
VRSETPLERSLLRACERELKKCGMLYRKRHGTALVTRGDPDLYLLVRGIHVEIELKRPGEKPSALQEFRLEEWRRAGAIVGVVTTVAELGQLLETVEALADLAGR